MNLLLAERLNDIKEYNDLIQEDMGKILGVDRSRYSRWETGKELIPLTKLNKLCNHFEVTMDYMIGKTRDIDFKGKVELDKKVVGSRLKQFRKAQHLTQDELAIILNTTQSTISAYESGETLLLISFALEIVNKYNISLDWLCGRVD